MTSQLLASKIMLCTYVGLYCGDMCFVDLGTQESYIPLLTTVAVFHDGGGFVNEEIVFDQVAG